VFSLNFSCDEFNIVVEAEDAGDEQEGLGDIDQQAIRDYGGSISRKQLTEILMKKFEVERTTVSRFLTVQIEAKALYEVGKIIHVSDDHALAF